VNIVHHINIIFLWGLWRDHTSFQAGPYHHGGDISHLIHRCVCLYSLA